METPPILFDSAARRKHLAHRRTQRAAHDFLHREAAAMLHDNLHAVTQPFARILILGEAAGLMPELAQRPGTQSVMREDEALLSETLPFAEDSLDAVIANLSLHAVNDLPGMLVQIRRALRPDGLFLATLPGAETLKELRQVLAEAEIARDGGMSPRVAPFVEVRDAGNLLQRAGFSLTVADSVTVPLTYSSLFALMAELRGAGEANMLRGRKKTFTARGFFVQAAERYAAQHGDGDGRIRATAEIITLTGWKPAPTQQQPARRGSGTQSLKEIF